MFGPVCYVDMNPQLPRYVIVFFFFFFSFFVNILHSVCIVWTLGTFLMVAYLPFVSGVLLLLISCYNLLVCVCRALVLKHIFLILEQFGLKWANNLLWTRTGSQEITWISTYTRIKWPLKTIPASKKFTSSDRMYVHWFDLHPRLHPSLTSLTAGRWQVLERSILGYPRTWTCECAMFPCLHISSRLSYLLLSPAK